MVSPQLLRHSIRQSSPKNRQAMLDSHGEPSGRPSEIERSTPQAFHNPNERQTSHHLNARSVSYLVNKANIPAARIAGHNESSSISRQAESKAQAPQSTRLHLPTVSFLPRPTGPPLQRFLWLVETDSCAILLKHRTPGAPRS